MGSEKKTIEERLAEQLDAKDEEIAKLEDRLHELQNQLKTSENGWLAHEKLSQEQTLPVPRLEIEVIAVGRSDEMRWYSREYKYRLVHKAFWGDIIGIPLGHTSSQGGNGQERPVYTIGPHAGKPHMPYRDGAHICHDMEALKLPGFLICEEVVCDISHLAGKPDKRW